MDEKKSLLGQEYCEESSVLAGTETEPDTIPATASPAGETLSSDLVGETQEPLEETPPVEELPVSEAEQDGNISSQTAGGMDDHPETDAALAADVAEIKSAAAAIAVEAKRTSREVHEMHRLYHNEFAGRLKAMQDELDRYHDVDKGRAFDGILSAIARIYGNNESLVDEIGDPKIKKHVQYFLLDLSDLLEEYGVQKLKSNVGDKRNIRHCQILERIATSDPALHDTIAASHNTGFYKDNRTIIKELVDVYFYDKDTEQAETSDETNFTNSASTEPPVG